MNCLSGFEYRQYLAKFFGTSYCTIQRQARCWVIKMYFYIVPAGNFSHDTFDIFIIKSKVSIFPGHSFFYISGQDFHDASPKQRFLSRLNCLEAAICSGYFNSALEQCRFNEWFISIRINVKMCSQYPNFLSGAVHYE